LENLENARQKNNSLISNLRSKQQQRAGSPPRKPQTREEAKERAKQLLKEPKEEDASNTALKVGAAIGAVAVAYYLYNRYAKRD
jgi:transposase-like protein